MRHGRCRRPDIGSDYKRIERQGGLFRFDLPQISAQKGRLNRCAGKCFTWQFPYDLDQSLEKALLDLTWLFAWLSPSRDECRASPTAVFRNLPFGESKSPTRTWLCWLKFCLTECSLETNSNCSDHLLIS
jgi:hypothetical protein